MTPSARTVARPLRSRWSVGGLLVAVLATSVVLRPAAAAEADCDTTFVGVGHRDEAGRYTLTDPENWTPDETGPLAPGPGVAACVVDRPDVTLVVPEEAPATIGDLDLGASTLSVGPDASLQIGSSGDVQPGGILLNGGHLHLDGGTVSLADGAGVLEVASGCLEGVGTVLGSVINRACVEVAPSSSARTSLVVTETYEAPTGSEAVLRIRADGLEDAGSLKAASVSLDGYLDVEPREAGSWTMAEGDGWLAIASADVTWGSTEFREGLQESSGAPGASAELSSSGVRIVVADVTAPTWPAQPAPGYSPQPDRMGLVWQPATDNVAVTHYDVSQDGVVVAHVPGDRTRTTVTGLSPSTTYVFTIEAVDAAGNRSEPVGYAMTTSRPYSPLPPLPPTFPRTVTAPPSVPVTSDGGTVTPSDPLSATVTSPSGGIVTFNELAEPAVAAPAGVRLVGPQIDITAPVERAQPMTIELKYHTAFPVERLVLLRNGELVPSCERSLGVLPCQSSASQERQQVALVAATYQASSWNVALVTDACIPALVGDPSFPDVIDTTHADAIACAAWWRLVDGESDGTFGPGETLTRGAFVAFLDRVLAAAGVELVGGDHAFGDVAGSGHADAIRRLVAADVVAGYADGTFRPDAPLSRAQAASLLVRAAELVAGLPSAPPAPFADVSGVHADAIAELVAAGVAEGRTAERFEPTAPVARGQAVSLVTRLLDVWVGDGEVVVPL